MGIFSFLDVYLRSLVRAPRLPLLAVGAGFLLLAAYGVIAAEPAKVSTQNQRCAAVQPTGAAQYDTTVECTFEIVRPSSDTSTDPIRVGIFAPEVIPGVTSWTVPGYTCAADGSRDGVKRTTCTGTQDAGSTVSASIRVHLTGPCGAQTAIGTQVNRNDVLSEFQNTAISLPACAGGASNTGSIVSSSSRSSRARATSSSSSVSVTGTSATYQCSDGADNDNDGVADFYDGGCSGPYDNNEAGGGTPAAAQSSVAAFVAAARSASSGTGSTAVAGYEDSVYIAAGSPNFTGSITMQKTADRGEASPGDRIWFTLTIRNNSPRTLTNLHLTDRFTSGDFTVVDAGGGEVSGSMIEWLNGGLQPNETKTLRYQVSLADHLTHGYIVQNNATLSGGELSRPVTASTNVGIMLQMPPTGFVKLQPLY